MVANPYGWYVDLSKGEADDGSKVTFWRWNPTTSEYEIPSVIGPYEAVWAKAPHALTWRVSAAPVFGMDDATDDSWGDSYEPLKKTLKKSGEKGFALVASLADENGKRDSWNVFGAGVEESLGEPPAGMGDHVSLAIREVNDRGEKGAKLSKSIKAVASEYRWILELSANSARDGKLSFEGLSDLNKLGLKLFVTIDGKTTEVENGKSLNVELAKSARSVEVRVAKSNVSVASAKLGALRPVMAENRLRVQFDVPESLAGAKASYAVMGVNGKKVAAGRFTASEGTNLVDMSVTRTGLYFVKVKVGSQELSGKVLKK
jgi:hypothetical protein